jgi:hypothetical protein
MANTTAIQAQTGNDASTSAAVYAYDYTNNSMADWYLPSKDELNELCKYAGNTGQDAGASTVCAGGTLRSGFSPTFYWSSSEIDRNGARYQDFVLGASDYGYKGDSISVRPVRAFGGTLTCADGGVCAVGETGPGGGVVFYVQAAGGTFTCGATLTSTCRYLEAAPANWLTGTIGDPLRTWATDNEAGVGIGNQATAVTGARGTAIGSGYKNSLAVVAQTGNAAATSAAVLSRAYEGNSKTDWYLPTKNELNELFLERARVGITTGDYWSSSESNDDTSWLQRFTDGSTVVPAKGDLAFVRPVRAFK